MMATLTRDERAAAYADLHDVPIEDIYGRYGAMLLTPARNSQEAEGFCAKVAGG